MIKDSKNSQILLVILSITAIAFASFAIARPSVISDDTGWAVTVVFAVLFSIIIFYERGRQKFYGRPLTPADMTDGEYLLEHLGSTFFFHI